MRPCSAVALSALLLTSVYCFPALAEVRIRIDQTNQRMFVSVAGQPLYRWSISTGVVGHRTPNGSFRASRLERTYYSRKYDNAPMPHAVFFTSKGHAIHGTNHVRQLGRAASHGCVRLSPSNAATLFGIVKAEGPGNTKITIVGSEPVVASRNGRGFRTGSQRHRLGDGGADAGWMPKDRLPDAAYDAPDRIMPSYRQPSYNQPSSLPYGYDPDDDFL